VSLVTKSDIEKVLSDIVNNFLEKKINYWATHYKNWSFRSL